MESIKNLLILLFIFTVAVALTGCSSSKPPRMKTSLESVSYLNPNIYNQPSPVVVTIYQLKSPTAFQQASFFSLYNNASAVLASDFIDKRDIEIRPQQKEKLEITMSPDTSYIGVLAAFRNPDNAKWRQIAPVKPGKNVKLKIDLASQSVDITAS